MTDADRTAISMRGKLIQAMKDGAQYAAEVNATNGPMVVRLDPYETALAAILDTLREPDEGMIEAADDHKHGAPIDCYAVNVPALFAAMIDHVRKS